MSYCVFLAKHPNYINKRNAFSWWWTEWYDYSRCKDTNNIIYGHRVIIWPNQTPDSSIYIQWSNELSLISPASSKQSPSTILGTSNFDTINKSNPMRGNFRIQQWHQLIPLVTEEGISRHSFGAIISYQNQIPQPISVSTSAETKTPDVCNLKIYP